MISIESLISIDLSNNNFENDISKLFAQYYKTTNSNSFQTLKLLDLSGNYFTGFCLILYAYFVCHISFV